MSANTVVVGFDRQPAPEMDKTDEMFDTQLTALAERAARKLRDRHETIAVAESSCGGLMRGIP